ncbi:MAG: DoxX family protein [Ferruginibacter sp.]
MNTIEKFKTWGDKHHPKWLDIIRIVLGIFLCYKGIDFLRNTSNIISMMQNTSFFSEFMIILIGHYVAFAHILGGFFLTLGLFTRAACIIQLPILLGAIVFININATHDAFSPYSELFLSILIFLLLFYFLIIGNGPLSVKVPPEEHLKEHRNYEHKVKGEPEE